SAPSSAGGSPRAPADRPRRETRAGLLDWAWCSLDDSFDVGVDEHPRATRAEVKLDGESVERRPTQARGFTSGDGAEAEARARIVGQQTAQQEGTGRVARVEHCTSVAREIDGHHGRAKVALLIADRLALALRQHVGAVD